MATTRIDLTKGAVLIADKMVPFKVIEHQPGERRVKGIWLLTGKEGYLPGSTATLPIDEEWIKKAIKEIESNIELMKGNINTLKYLI